MIVAKWSWEGLYKGDAQTVAEEIKSIGDEATPAQILEKAKDETTELHKCFDWNDSTAAEKWRLYTARQIVCHLVIEQKSDDAEKEPVRVFYKTPINDGYKPVELIMRNDDEYQALLKQAKAELRVFKQKYSRLSELEEIFALID